MAEQKPGILRNLRFKRVSLVDMGANFDPATGDGAHIMLYKAAPRPVEKDGPGLGAVHCDSPEWDAADQDEYEKATLDATGRRALSDADFAAVWTDAQGQKHRKLPIHDAGHLAAARGRVDAADIPADVKAAARRKLDVGTTTTTTKEKPVAKTLSGFIKSLLSAVAEPDAEKRAALLKAAEDAAPPDAPAAAHTDDNSHISALQNLHKDLSGKIKAFGAGPHPADHPVHAMKAMHEGVGQMLKAAGAECPTDEPGMLNKGVTVDKATTERFEKMEKANEDLRKQLRGEQETRLDGEMHTLLKSFKATPFKLEGADSDVAKFRKMKETEPELFNRTMELMKAQDAIAASSKLFGNIGANGSGQPGDAWAQLEAKANELVEKSTTGLTYEAALDRVMMNKANAKLVVEYRAQQQ